MTRDVRREGLRLMDEGRRILQRDATGALADAAFVLDARSSRLCLLREPAPGIRIERSDDRT